MFFVAQPHWRSTVFCGAAVCAKAERAGEPRAIAEARRKDRRVVIWRANGIILNETRTGSSGPWRKEFLTGICSYEQLIMIPDDKF